MSRTGRRVAGAAFLVLAGAGLAHGFAASAARIVRGPYLQPAPPGHALVVWYTDVATAGRLQWRAEGGAWMDARSANEDARRHEVLLARVREGLLHQYRVVDSGVALANLSSQTEFSFRVSSQQSVKLVSWGDSGSGLSAQKDLASRLLEETPPPDLVLLLGDVVYPSGADAEYDARFFAPYAPILARVPFYAAIGNHDYETRRGSAFLDVFSLPRNGAPGLVPETTYSFERGGALFLIHDSNLEGAESLAEDWHVERVRESGSRFRIAALHHSPYSSATNSVTPAVHDLREVFPPLFAATGIDLVLGAHDHVYERTRPLGGVVYITSGAGGAAMYPRLSTHEYTEIFVGAGSLPSYTVVEVSGANLVVQQKDSSGCVVDRLGLYKPVGEGDLWRIFRGSAAPPSDWFLPSFQDRAWTAAKAPLGHGGPDLATTLPDTDKYVSVYARTSFALGPGDVDHVVLRLRYRDGFVFYLNGVEVARRNVPAGQSSRTPASASHSGEFFETFTVPASLLDTGTNVIALEGHRALDGADFVIAPELTLVGSEPGRCY
jgi:3',5'-cyclic AMP phosphodiesterase CpdA